MFVACSTSLYRYYSPHFLFVHFGLLFSTRSHGKFVLKQTLYAIMYMWACYVCIRYSVSSVDVSIHYIWIIVLLLIGPAVMLEFALQQFGMQLLVEYVEIHEKLPTTYTYTSQLNRGKEMVCKS